MESKQNNLRVALQGYIPLRKEAQEGSEMTSQILFGEYAEVLEEKGKWLYVKTLSDNYEGWIDKKCIGSSAEIQKATHIAIKNTRIKNTETSSHIHVPAGACFPDVFEGKFTLAGYKYELTDKNSCIAPGSIALEEVIEELITVPYIWGGRSGFGFDCSGLTQFLCRVAGKNIPRDSGQQAKIGENLNFLNETKTGDLAFFDNAEGIIEHVGMLINKDRIVHASGLVRIDRIDQQGIFNTNTGTYTHKLRVVKRL